MVIWLCFVWVFLVLRRRGPDNLQREQHETSVATMSARRNFMPFTHSSGSLNYRIPEFGLALAQSLVAIPVTDAAMQATARQFHAAFQHVVIDEQKNTQRAPDTARS
jgi:hypothetical protein